MTQLNAFKKEVNNFWVATFWALVGIEKDLGNKKRFGRTYGKSEEALELSRLDKKAINSWEKREI